MSGNILATPWSVVHNSWEVSTVYDAENQVVAEVPIDSRVEDEDTQELYEPIKQQRAEALAAFPDCIEALQAALDALDMMADGRSFNEAVEITGCTARICEALKKIGVKP